MAVILPSLVSLLLVCFSAAVPLDQSTTTFTGAYDAVVVGPNEVVELMPDPNGAPVPVTLWTNVDVESCGSQEVCLVTRISDNAGHISTAVTQYFNAPPASVQAAVSGIVGAIEQGNSEFSAGQTATSTSTSLGPSSLYSALAQIVSDIKGAARAGSKVTTTIASSTTNPGFTPVTTYATQVTNAQGSTVYDVVAVGFQSGTAYTSVLSEYPDSITTTVQTLPSDATIQIKRTSTRVISAV